MCTFNSNNNNNHNNNKNDDDDDDDDDDDVVIIIMIKILWAIIIFLVHTGFIKLLYTLVWSYFLNNKENTIVF